MAFVDERPYWPKWIWASVAKYMKGVSDSLNLQLLVEGIDDRQSKNVRAEKRYRSLFQQAEDIFLAQFPLVQVQMQ